MDRLPIVMSLAAALLVGCSGEPAPATPPPSRVDAVVATPTSERDVAGFCEVRPTGADAPALSLPELDGPETADAAGWTWLNVWATWCGPCIEEMPLIRQWQDKLKGDGVQVNVRYLSVDDNAEIVQKFRGAHPDFPASMRVRSFDLVAGWLPKVGLDGNAAIPIHIFADPDDHIRCVRTGSVGPADYPLIRKILGGA